jgi:endo-beta-N-acetylglucosaminidase D
MDVPHTHIINHPLDTEFDHEVAFMGASSLKIRRETIKLLKILIPTTINLAEPYYLVVTVHGTQSVNALFKYATKNEEDRAFTAKLMNTEEAGEWKIFTFRLVTSLKALRNNVRSIVELTSIKYPYNLG